MELTTEQKQQIVLEEQARFEIRKQLEAQAQQGAPGQASDGVAAVLSLFLPGAGHMYKGRVGLGFLWLFLTAFGYLAFIFPGLCFHVACIFHAKGLATAGNAGLPQDQGLSANAVQ